MALNKDTLGTAINTALLEFNNKDKDALGDIGDARLNFCKAIAGAVIDHIKSSALVSVNVTVTTAGTATNQAGTGTGTGTIS